jgi:EAL domain-containing protein (putative c-di-GMP-specific phosphodiesterase class I)
VTTELNMAAAASDPAYGEEPPVAPLSTQPVRWPADLVASTSAALAGVAVHTAAKQHLALEPSAIFAIAMLVFAALIALHLVLRIEPRAVEKGERRRKKRSKRTAEAQDADHKIEPSDLALELTGRGQDKVLRNGGAAPVAPSFSRAHTPVGAVARPRAPDASELPLLLRPDLDKAVLSPGAARPRPDADAVAARQQASLGFDKLQVLVAELARSTPGPKADTPDPDRVPAPAETLERSRVAQTDALADAARIMQRAAPPVRTGLAATLADALEDERMTVYLEPIQQMAHGRPRHYEISIRFRGPDGAELPHDAVLVAARYAGLLPKIDAAVVPRAARIAQHFQLRGRDTDILARVHAVSLPDHEFRAEVAAAAIAADGAAPVLSFAQSDIRGFGRIHWDILSTLADMGVRFAIESVTDLDMDLERLKRQGFVFAKLDKNVLLRGLPAPEGTIPTADVCRHFANAGLSLIINHIDDEAALARILGFGVLFGQGSLFGGPRAVRDDLLSRSAA